MTFYLTLTVPRDSRTGALDRWFADARAARSVGLAHMLNAANTEDTEFREGLAALKGTVDTLHRRDGRPHLEVRDGALTVRTFDEPTALLDMARRAALDATDPDTPRCIVENALMAGFDPGFAGDRPLECIVVPAQDEAVIAELFEVFGESALLGAVSGRFALRQFPGSYKAVLFRDPVPNTGVLVDETRYADGSVWRPLDKGLDAKDVARFLAMQFTAVEVPDTEFGERVLRAFKTCIPETWSAPTSYKYANAPSKQ